MSCYKSLEVENCQHMIGRKYRGKSSSNRTSNFDFAYICNPRHRSSGGLL